MQDGLGSRVRHRRTLKSVAKAVLRRQNHRAVLRVARGVRDPLDFLSRYVRNRGSYPARIGLRTPTGPVELTTYSYDDVATINEIFFRGDYDVGAGNRVVVDFGSNIGISAAYFLTRDPQAFVHCFEPVEQNAVRLRANLASFDGRYALEQIAVGETTGTVRFGWEPTGKYGGVGRDTGQSIDVPCRDSNDVLREVVARHGHIDLLKIDVETLEKALTERLPRDLLLKIRALAVEYPFATNVLEATHDWERRNAVTVFTLRPQL